MSSYSEYTEAETESVSISYKNYSSSTTSYGPSSAPTSTSTSVTMNSASPGKPSGLPKIPFNVKIEIKRMLNYTTKSLYHCQLLSYN